MKYTNIVIIIIIIITVSVNGLTSQNLNMLVLKKNKILLYMDSIITICAIFNLWDITLWFVIQWDPIESWEFMYQPTLNYYLKYLLEITWQVSLGRFMPSLAKLLHIRCHKIENNDLCYVTLKHPYLFASMVWYMGLSIFIALTSHEVHITQSYCLEKIITSQVIMDTTIHGFGLATSNSNKHTSNLLRHTIKISYYTTIRTQYGLFSRLV